MHYAGGRHRKYILLRGVHLCSSQVLIHPWASYENVALSACSSIELTYRSYLFECTESSKPSLFVCVCRRSWLILVVHTIVLYSPYAGALSRYHGLASSSGRSMPANLTMHLSSENLMRVMRMLVLMGCQPQHAFRFECMSVCFMASVVSCGHMIVLN